MTIMHLDPKARRERVREAARKAMKMIDDTLRNRKIEIMTVSIAGDREEIQMDFGGLILATMQTGPRTFTITIETYPRPTKKGRR